MQHVPLLVLGAGVDGLAAALALAHQGFPVHLAERAPGPGPDPAGGSGTHLLPPDACRELAALGLLDRVLGVATEPDRLVHLDALSGRILRDLDLGATVRSRFDAPLLCVPEAALRGVLTAACAADEMITVEYGVRPTTVDDAVEAALVGNEEGPLFRAEALVAADGVGSRARLLLGDGEPVAAPFAVTAAWREPAGPRSVVRAFSSPWLHASWTPGTEADGFSLITRADVPPPELWRLAEQAVPELREPALAALDAGPAEIVRHHRPLARWARHRLVVTGAAAQPLLPHRRHGAAQALLDAAALGRAFDRCDGRVLEAFESYERIRAAAAARSAARAHDYAGLCHAEGLTRRLRDRHWSGVAPDLLAEVTCEG